VTRIMRGVLRTSTTHGLVDKEKWTWYAPLLL